MLLHRPGGHLNLKVFMHYSIPFVCSCGEVEIGRKYSTCPQHTKGCIMDHEFHLGFADSPMVGVSVKYLMCVGACV